MSTNIDDLVKQIETGKGSDGESLSLLNLSKTEIDLKQGENFARICQAIEDSKTLAEIATHVILEDQLLGDEGINKVAKFLKSLPKLEYLNLTNNNFGLKGMQALCENLKGHPCINELVIVDNPKLGTEQGSSLLPELVKTTKTLTSLACAGCFGSDSKKIEDSLKSLFAANKDRSHSSAPKLTPAESKAIAKNELIRALGAEQLEKIRRIEEELDKGANGQPFDAALVLQFQRELKASPRPHSLAGNSSEPVKQEMKPRSQLSGPTSAIRP